MEIRQKAIKALHRFEKLLLKANVVLGALVELRKVSIMSFHLSLVVLLIFAISCQCSNSSGNKIASKVLVDDDESARLLEWVRKKL